MKKKQGFTLIELLVVIAIIAMLLAILMPALGKVKKLAMRLVCGTNVKGFGTAMNVYAFDYNDEFPKQGGSGPAVWDLSITAGWKDPSDQWNIATKMTVASSLYMLVREADVSPKSFICPASNDLEFKISEDPDLIPTEVAELELTDLYDFGIGAGGYAGDETCHLSYSYQQPYDVGTHRSYSADASGNAARVILGDKSPYGDPDLKVVLPKDTTDDWKGSEVSKIIFGDSSSNETVQRGNSAMHDREGQNVLYNDGHVEFARRPDVSVNNDNIYTRKVTGTSEDNRRGGQMIDNMLLDGWSNGASDTMLVHDNDAN